MINPLTRLLLIGLLLIFLCIRSQAQSKHIASQRIFLIDKVLQNYPAASQFAVAVVQNGETRYYGAVFKDGRPLAVQNQDSVFEIGSISKVFTATLLAQAVLTGQVKLKDNIQEACNCQLKDQQEITYESLANHTAGLPRLPSNLRLGEVDPTNPYSAYDESKLLSYLKDELQLSSSAKAEYAYSNLGAGLLGYCLTQIGNKSYEELLQSQIFGPYNMTASTSLRNRVEEQLVAGRNAWGQVASNWDMSALVGAGGILSSVSDLAKFVQAQFQQEARALSLSRSTSFIVNKKLNLGLGWHISKGEAKQDVHWHNGGTGGYSSCLAMDVEKKTAVIILTNVSAFHPKRGKIDKLCFDLLEQLR